MIPRLLCTAIFISLLVIIPSYKNTAKADSASRMVESFQSALLKVMKAAHSTSVRERYDRLVPAVSKHFHIPLMTQIVLGQHWSSAQPSDRTAAIAAFQRMNVATLATLFDDYSGETFEVEGERPGPSRTTIVFTNLIKSDSSRIKIYYVARKFSGDWRLIDVVVDGGISELKVRRSEYHLTLVRSGLSSLVQLLNNKADELMSN